MQLVELAIRILSHKLSLIKSSELFKMYVSSQAKLSVIVHILSCNSNVAIHLIQNKVLRLFFCEMWEEGNLWLSLVASAETSYK